MGYLSINMNFSVEGEKKNTLDGELWFLMGLVIIFIGNFYCLSVDKIIFI
jgi:hypothetical protein